MKKAAIIFLILLLCAATASGFQMHSRLDPRVDPEDSPTFVDLILTGGNIMSASSINLKPSDDTDDYLSFSTVAGVPTITPVGGFKTQLKSPDGNVLAQLDIFNYLNKGISLTYFSSISGFSSTDAIALAANDGRIRLTATEEIIIRPSADTDDYLQVTTVANIPTIQAVGGTLIDLDSNISVGGYIIADGTIDGTVITASTKLATDLWEMIDSGDVTAEWTGSQDGYADFPGTNDYVDIGPDSTFQGGSDFSIALWFKMDTNQLQTLAAAFDLDGSVVGWQALTNAGGNVIVAARDADGDVASATSAATYGTGTWIFVTATWNNTTKTVELYVNDATVVTDTDAAVGSIVSGEDFLFGISNDLTRDFNGQMSDVIWFDTVISGADVAAIYAAGRNPQTYTHANLVSWWKLTQNFTDSIGTYDGSAVGDTEIIVTDTRDLTVSHSVVIADELTVEGNATVNGAIQVDNLIVNLDSWFSGELFIQTEYGINYNPGSDTDCDLITVGVSGTPTIYWDETGDRFVATHPIAAPAFEGLSDIHLDENSIFFSKTDSAKIYLDTDAPLPGDAWTFWTDNVAVTQIVLASERIVLDANKNTGTPTIRTLADENNFSWKETSRHWLEASYDNRVIVIGGDVSETGDPLETRFENNQAPDGYAMKIDHLASEVYIEDYLQITGVVDLLHPTGDIDPDEMVYAQHINIDETLAVSSDSTSEICGLHFGTTTAQDITKVAMCVNAGFDYALVVRGALPEDPNHGYENTSGVVVDRVNSGGGGNDAFISASTNVQIFDNDDDYILIGSDNPFEDIQVALNIVASGSIFSNPIAEDIYYSKAGGNWTALTILDDGTNGFQNSGNIMFNAPGDWTKDDEDLDANAITNAYYILILRTRAVLGTPPTELVFQIFESLETGATLRGNGTFKPVSLPDNLAPNESIYFSSTQGVLVYKDSGGTVRDLY